MNGRSPFVMQRLLLRLAGRMPAAWRRSLMGSPDRPTGLAMALHRLLNRLPVERFPVLSCRRPLEGFRMRLDWLTQRSFAYGTWEPAVAKALEAQVQPGMTALDIGAHIGYYTLLLAKLVGNLGRVMSFEPTPNNYARLVENINLNDLKNVTPLNLAVLARAREMEVNLPQDEPYSGSISLYEDYGTQRIAVHAVSLDEFFSGSVERIDFVKMDVEGAEGEVIHGGMKTLERFHPQFLIELHHFDGSVAMNPVPNLLDSLGYRVTWLERWELTSHILAVPKT